jgi:predicted Zn-dependent peptidase
MIRKEKLDNGLTVITESMPHVRSVAIGIWLRQGSRHEPAELNGASHFIEHLVFKGTENRSAREIALAMDTVGGQMDAFTSKEYTCFYAKVLDEHVPVAVDLLSDIVLRPRFDPDDLERERKVVMEEIRMVEDSPEELVYDLFSSHFYPKHPLGRPIQGTETTVAGLSRLRLLRFFHGAYRPGNMLIAAAGNIRHDRFARTIRRVFGKMPRTRDGSRPTTTPRPNPGLVTRSKRELEQLHLVLGVPGFPERFDQRYSLFVLNALFGGTMSSRLFQKVREERGLAYSVYSAVNAFADAGLLMVYAATSPSKGKEVLRLILAEIEDLAERKPDASETEVAKEHLKGSLMLSLESTVSRMSNLARQDIYFGRQFSLEETIRGVESVSRESIHRVAKRLFESRRLAVAAVGRTSGLRLGRGTLTS